MERIELKAAQRLQVLADQKIQRLGPQFSRFMEWVATLGEKEKEFLFVVLPRMIDGWYKWDFMGRMDSDRKPLQLEASVYRKVDSFVIALSYLRQFYPPKPPGTVYRVTHVNRLPSKKIILFKLAQQLKPVTSWTTRKNPLVSGRSSEGISIILEAKINGRERILADSKSLGAAVTAIRAAAPKVLTSPAEKEFCEHGCRSALNTIKAFAKEEEVLVYLNKGKPLPCTWRPVTDNKHGVWS